MRMLRVGRWITGIALLLLVGVYIRALVFTPVERLQGLAQKIYYLHVPAAIWTETAIVLGICGMCLVPFIHFSVYLFPTLHPMPIMMKPSPPSMPGSMVVTSLFSVGVFTLLYVGFVVQRYALSYFGEQLELVGEEGRGKGEG